MNPSLTTRLKENLQWLAEKMPEKLFFILAKGTFCPEFRLNGKTLVEFDGDNAPTIHPDPKREFSNSLGRIVWEAFEERFYVMASWDEMGEFNAHTVHRFNKDWDYCQYSIVSIKNQNQLETETKAVCIRIEQERGKQ